MGEETGVEEDAVKCWAAPPIPVCAAVDHTSLLVEWSKYVDFVDGSEYCLDLGFRRSHKTDPQGRKPGRKNAGVGGGGSTEIIEFSMVSCSDFSPEGFCSSKDGHSVNFDGLDWKTVYRGLENSHKVEDLIPGMGYVFRLCVILPNPCSNDEPIPPPILSHQIMFFTIPCGPHPPDSPILVDRGRTSLKLKWSPPLITGGMQIRDYLFEMKRPGFDFECVYSGGTNLSAKVTRLVPGTNYNFRIKASTCLGWSDFSKEVAYSTASSVPAAPSPPRLTSASQNSISLCWEEPDDHGSAVSSYILEADDGSDGTFSVAYSGEKRSCEVGNLKSGTSYRFRVLAHNDIGKGSFSATATFSTLHSPPSAPRSVTVSGRTPSSAIICWNIPDYNGGSSIIGYDLEMKSKIPGSNWSQAYSGQSSTCTLNGLRPGCQYRVRVRARNAEGFGDFAHEVSFTTSPGVSEAPSSPSFPEVLSTSLKVSWERPNHDGGSPITAYRLEMLTAETNESVCAYRGSDLFAEVDNLIPGTKYTFKVQALNKTGSSAWSGFGEICTKPTIPDAPESPVVVGVSSTTVSLRWISPKENGSSILSYRLQMAVLGYKATIQQSSMLRIVSSGTHRYVVLEENGKEDQYAVQCIYDGPAMGYTVKKLQSCTSYAFFLQASNSVGESACSKIIVCSTSPSCPSPPPPPIATETLIDTLSLQWDHPDRDNGSPITSFHLDIKHKSDDKPISKKPHREETPENWTEVYKGSDHNYTITSLLPGNTYLFRLVAHNVYGPSTPSYLTVSTQAACPIPPSPPTFSGISPTSVRIRWSAPARDNGSPILRYKLLIDHSKPGHLQKVYEGDSTSYRVMKLAPGRSYQAAVQAINSAGTSPLSGLSSVTLPEQILLPALDAPRLACSSNDNDSSSVSVSISWNPLDLREVVSYTLQMESTPGKLLHVYEGSTPRFDISASGKRCKFRVRANGKPEHCVSGPWSPFATLDLDSMTKQRGVDGTTTTRQRRGLASSVRGLYRGLADPWSVERRRRIALAGTVLTLVLALYTNSVA